MRPLAIVVTCGLLGVVCYGAESSGPNLHELMKNVISVQSQIIWDIGNRAQDDEGNIDARKLTAADWAKIAAAAGRVKRAAQSLASAPHVMAAAPGQKIQSEGEPSAFGASDVQRALDAQPKVFGAFTQQLVGSMDEVLASVTSHDGRKLGEVSNRLDEVCESCHKLFWYPNQKEGK
jgi:cytochrome c556